MSDPLSDLYQEIILQHSRKPHNYGPLEKATHKAPGYNPSCGDAVTIELRAEEGVIEAIRFTGAGCSISQASASMMTEALKGKTLSEAKALLKGFLHLLASSEPLTPEALMAYGDLTALAGVRQFPQRLKCATLAWHALEECLRQKALE